jgi:hypothetical protein
MRVIRDIENNNLQPDIPKNNFRCYAGLFGDAVMFLMFLYHVQ